MTAALGIPPPTLAGWVAAGVAAVLLGLLALAVINRVLSRMALRNIPRRRGQSALIVLGLMLASLIITAAFTVGDTLSYSLQSIEMTQIGGIDEAVGRQDNHTPAGTGTSDADFFTAAQAANVIGQAHADPNVDSAAGVIVASGAVSDTNSGQASSENLVVFGVPNEFDRLWGGLHSRAGGSVSVADLGPGEVFIGTSLADKLNAGAGDRLQLIMQGKPVDVRVRSVLNTEVNPTIANQGPVVGSVLLPLATMRTALSRPAGFNLIYLHNRGSGGIDDLGPNGSAGQEVVRRLRGSFIDETAAAELHAYLKRPGIHAQLQSIHDKANFLDPDKQLSQSLLLELGRPAVTPQFKALVADRFEQRLIVQAATQALPGNASPSATQAATTEVQQRLGALNVSGTAALQIRELLQVPEVRQPLRQLAAGMAAENPARGALDNLLAEPAAGALSPGFKAALTEPGLRQQLRQLIAAVAPAELTRYDRTASELQLNVLTPYKSDGVFFAQESGLIASAALLSVSFFSLAVGVLLIFLIFVMLAAERRSEMGMSRAVGLKRRHLTQMFLFEGMAYTMGASLVGVALGLAVGKLMVGVISSIFTGFYKGLDLIYHVEWPSVVIALGLGVALTFAVVVVSAYRVSRLNIVAAIRDLDESEARDPGLGHLLAAIFVNLGRGFRQLRHGHPLLFLGRLSFGTAGAVASLLWALFRRGPLALLLGAAAASTGLSLHSEIVYSGGVSLLLIGGGLLLRWLLKVIRLGSELRSRIGFTSAALGLLVYWGRPFGRVENLLHLDKLLQLSTLTGGAEVFALSALMVLLGAIWAVMYNSDLLIRGVMLLTAGRGSLSAGARTSMTYPMSTKFRTGMAVAMFAIVTFMIAYMAVFKDVLTQNFEDVSAQSGGWQLVAGTPDNNYQPSSNVVFPSQLAATVRSDPTLNRELKGIGWEQATQSVSAREVPSGGTAGQPQPTGGGNRFGLHVVDDGYLSGTGYAVLPRAAGYTDDRAVWNAVRDHPGYAVIDTSVLDARGTTPAVVSGISPNDSTFKPFQLELQGSGEQSGSTGPKWRVTVIGFMTRPLWNGVYVSTRTAQASGMFSALGTAAGGLAANGDSALNGRPALTPSGFYFSVQPGVDLNRARLDLGRRLVRYQLEPVSVADQVAQGNSAILTLLNLLTGFLALGLVVGIAGLGVISTRAVVERRQQIGMMRAIGFRRSLVQRSFLLESSFIAILGLLLGTLVGLWQSYRFFVTDKTFGTVVFHVPVVELSLILLGSYLATLLTTYLPARAASRVPPAEALRFE